MNPEQEPFSIARAIQAGIEQHRAGRLAEAEQIYRRILNFDPVNADAIHLLGVIAGQLGKLDIAVELIGKAVSLQPSNADFHFNLGNALKDAGRHVEAEHAYRGALNIRPDYAEAHLNLGILLKSLGRIAEAMQCYRRALEFKPAYPEALNNLGNTLQELGRPDEGEKCYRQALAERPGYADALVNLGQALRAQGRLSEAEASLRAALNLVPNQSQVHNYLANVLRNLGRIEEAEASYRRALTLNPGNSEAHSNLVFLLNYIGGRSPAQIFAEHREFARRFCRARDPAEHRNAPDPARRLRIGYVSGDLRDHAVAFFIEPVLANHNHTQFEVFCYYNFALGDAVTQRLRGLADHWREIAAMDDNALVELVRGDAIDILIDLSGHTGHSRLLAFCRRPAPVQATWLGYLNTTGIDAMDYRITDVHASPRGPLDAMHTEKLVRLAGSQWCYRPSPASPDVTPPPCLASGHVTFASFTNPAKLGDAMIRIWSRLLTRVPEARLLVGGATLASIPDDLIARLTKQGIAHQRLEVAPARPFPEYLAMHRSADIVLDTYPYSGGTTTCHALWMGLPVVTLAGNTATSRGGASLLHVAGLKELIAETPQQYVNIAAGLAGDPKRLARLRAGMRKRLAASPLMDEVRFTRILEKAYRAMWQRWCEQRGS